MKITKDSFDKFYFGEASEKYIQSEFYAQGYEALKTSPDIGYDLLVTNCARTKFLDEESRQYNIQVKSRVFYSGTVCFFINKEDFEDLLQDINGYLICVLCKPILSDGRENITIFRESNSERDSHIWEEFGRNLLIENAEYLSLEKLKGIPYIGYEHEYVWFNNAQLKRLSTEKLLYENNGFVCINFSVSSENEDEDITLSLVDKDKNSYCIESNSLYATTIIGYEQRHIKYLVQSDVCDSSMFAGDMYI